MLGNGFERLELNNITGENSAKQRIFQKIFFNEIILDTEFFNLEQIADTEIYFLNVNQLDPNTRAVIIGDFLYKFTPENPLYNYLDNGRGIYYNNNVCYIFNDLKVSREDLKIVDCWQNSQREINFKHIWELPSDNNIYGHNEVEKVYLIFNEDIERIKTEVYREKESERQGELERKKASAEQEIINKEQEKKSAEILKNYMTLPKIEDKDIIIKDNYFIEKNNGLKIEFTKKITDIFDQSDLLINYGYNSENFIDISYRSFLSDLVNIYYIGKHTTDLDEKIKSLNLSNKKHWLHYKFYSYNAENKTEEFLAEIKIENKLIKDKYKFFINGVKIPKQKMAFALRFLGGEYGYYGNTNTEILINRFKNLDITLQQIKKYSGTQLDLLEGKTININYNNMGIPLQFEISNPDFDKENWQINFNGYKVSKTYNEVKQALWYSYRHSSDIVSSITQISGFLGDKIEDVIIDYVKKYIEKRKQAEKKARQLFLDFTVKNKSRVIQKDSFYIIKGKLKNYKLFFKNDNDVGVESYPNGNYICINEKSRKGNELVGYDKMLQFALALLNDSGLRKEIYTLS